ncbi:hypothetical protein [Dactylosporangium sp. CA-233914]|uniref:hypothetical protein n=1 Tax=Dactylosporangium sp. CA-233914 TaxID=3239934 RepID=UPI003D935893
MTDITLDGSDVPQDERPELESVLSKLAEAHGPEPWGTPPVRIEVRRKLSGLGGATVLDVVVHHERRTFVVVVKVDTAERTRTEYQAYDEVVRPAASELCPPIVAATPGVLGPGSREREAIVYQHVAAFVGEPAAALTTLEDVFARASLGDAGAARRATAAVASTLSRARDVFHGAPVVAAEASLKELAGRLGPDIAVEPGPGGSPVYPSQILAAGTAAPHGVGVGDRVTITGLTLGHLAGVPVGLRDSATAEIRGGTPPGVAPGEAFDLDGRVVAVRPETVRRRLEQHVDGLREVAVADPYAGLRRALLGDRLPAVRSRVHGDLNARNVLLVDSPHGLTPHDRPYLIDYAAATQDGHLLADFVCLEVNLMRACAGDPRFADLVRLQRTLAAAATLFAFGPDEDRGPAAPVSTVHAAMTGLLPPGPAAVWPALARLRWEAWRSYPRQDRARWFADYNRHLIVAAHRTFKWPDAQQAPTRLAASAAVAAVGAEWQDLAAAFANWPDGDLAALATALPDALARAGVAGAPLLGAVAAEADRRGATGEVAGALTAAAVRVAAAALRPPAPGPARRPFIDLAAEPVGTADPAGEVLGAVTALAAEPFAVLAGPPDSGKTTVATTMAERMLAARSRLPVLIPAADLPGGGVAQLVARHAPLTEAAAGHVEDLLRAGCLHVTVDGIATATQWPGALAWAREVRRAYPRTAVLLCGRTLPGAEPGGPRRYRLLPPTAAMAVAYLTESAALGSLPVRNVRRVLAGAPATAELLASPLWLSMLAEHLAPHGRPPGLGALLERHFAGRPQASAAGWDAACTAAAAFAAGGAAPAGADRALLVAAGILAEPDAGPAFARPAYRDFFAATHLIRHPGEVAARARRLDWQEPLRLAASRDERPAGLLAAVLPVVRRADPAFAGRLIAAAGLPAHDETVRAFVAEQDETLRDEAAGDAAWRRAAAALVALGPHGARPLRDAIGDPARPEGARTAGLAAFGAAAPVNLLRDLLADPGHPAGLRADAARLAADRRATHLALLIADGCGPDAPWAYRRAAHAALDRLGVPLPATQRAAYRSAAAGRLAELDRLLPMLSTTAAADAAQDEQRELLRGPLAGDRELVLAHRSTFDLGDAVPDVPDADPDPEILARTLPAEALAALLVAVAHRDPVRGGRLAVGVADALAEHPARLRWPLRTAIARAMPRRELWSRLLVEEPALGVATLCGPGFHLDGARPEEYDLSPHALRALAAAAPAAAPAWAAVDFVRAAATARLTEALPLVGELLDLAVPGAMVREATYREYGILSLAWPSELLSAGGFLASLAPPGDRAAAAVERRIAGLDPAGRHPSVAAGRLIALGYLGDPEPLLSNLDTAEPRLHAAASHAALNPALDAQRVMDAVAAARATARTPRARTTLQDILDELSRRTGLLPDVTGRCG